MSRFTRTDDDFNTVNDQGDLPERKEGKEEEGVEIGDTDKHFKQTRKGSGFIDPFPNDIGYGYSEIPRNRILRLFGQPSQFYISFNEQQQLTDINPQPIAFIFHEDLLNKVDIF